MWKWVKKYLFPGPPVDTWKSEKKWREEIYNPEQQRLTDIFWDAKIELEAERLFNEWEKCKPIIINEKCYKLIVPIVSFNTGVYTIYDYETAKYKKGEQEQKVMELYKELIKQYENVRNINQRSDQ